MHEKGAPFDAQRQLFNIGITQQEISLIRAYTLGVRGSLRTGVVDLPPDFLAGSVDFIHSAGNYQIKRRPKNGRIPPYINM